jgi:type IV secretion system protein TrbF
MSLRSMFSRPEKYNQARVRNPSSPAERAEGVWDRRDGSAIVQAYNWRRISIGLIVVCIVLAGGLTVQSLKTRVIPYVVIVDKTTGEVEKAGAFVGKDYTPGEAEIKYFITKFIQNARNIGIDPIAYNTTQKQAASFLTKNAAQKYNKVLQDEGHDKKAGKVTVVTHIVSVQKVPDSEASYQVRWTEEEVGIQSGEQTITPMSGIFSYTMLPVKDEKQILVNPLGLYITDFNFSKDASAVNAKTSVPMKK